MKYLLDTEVWLWTVTDPERIDPGVRELIAGGEEELYLSAATSWEISIKSALGKLTLPEPPALYIPSRMLVQGIRSLPITHSHALGVSVLPMHHKDPFDRLLIAQARAEEMVVLTADRSFARYEVGIRWSGRRSYSSLAASSNLAI